VVTDVEHGESGGEVCRVTREEISVDAVQRVANLLVQRVLSMNMGFTQIS
jgi:hypothetical protein